MRIALTIALMSIVLSVHAQQLMQYTQFMFNRQAMNPAYAGFSGDQLNASVMGKWQWSGLDGAPRTKTLALDSYPGGKKIGLGLVVHRDEITVFSTTALQLNYAYHLVMKEKQRLSLGLSGSLTNFSARYADLGEIDPDPNFAGNASDWAPNFGFGAYYTLGNFNAGFSVPLLLDNDFRDNDQPFYTERKHYFITAGYAFQVNPAIRIEPNVLLKTVAGSPLGIDVNALTWIKETVAAGLAYRAGESVGLLLQFKPTDNIRVGYSFDYIIDKTLSSLSSNSHEVMLAYRIPSKKKQNTDKDRDGVADADQDGVPDTEDQCPDLAGTVTLHGCPDTDKDGVADPNDKCPDIAGAAADEGCPPTTDTDQDGVPDDRDNCPDVAGTASANGCPETEQKQETKEEPKEELRQILPPALSAVRFQHNSDRLLESAQEILTQAAEILKNNPNCRLVITGHTDNTGTEKVNLELSKMRAERVRDYLAEMGVDISRTIIEGEGEEKPIADNDTKNGRALNRRVELETLCK